MCLCAMLPFSHLYPSLTIEKIHFSTPRTASLIVIALLGQTKTQYP
jgi:hypothetical protein